MSYLPVEILIEVLSWRSSRSDLAAQSLTSKAFAAAAQHLLFASPRITSLESFDLLFRSIDPIPTARTLEEVDYDEHFGGSEMMMEIGRAQGVRKVEVVCRKYGTRGWGPRIGHLMRICGRIDNLEINGVEDMRIKYLYGHGALRTLILHTTTFRANSLPSSPHLHDTLKSVTTLHLINLGLPQPCTHFYHLIEAATAVQKLIVSDVRDLTDEVFSLGLNSTSPSLTSLTFGNLSDTQYKLLSTIFPNLKTLERLEFTSPSQFGWWNPQFDHTTLSKSITFLKLRCLKRDYGEIDWEPLINALGRGFARRVKIMEICNAWVPSFLQRAVEDVGIELVKTLV